jgi:hypothetical protein
MFNLSAFAIAASRAAIRRAHPELAALQFTRAQAHLLPGAEQPVNLASPEDVLLNKLMWYELGNRVSDQQWRDALGIIRVQAGALDMVYLRRWASELKVGDLLETALRGERPPAPGDDPRQRRMF